MDRMIPMGHLALYMVKILMAVREDMGNNRPVAATDSPKVASVSSRCMGATLSSLQDTTVTLHREWLTEGTDNLLLTMAHPLAMDRPRAMDRHKVTEELLKVMASNHHQDMASLMVQGFVRPGIRDLEQQMEKMEAGSIVVYLS